MAIVRDERHWGTEPKGVLAELFHTPGSSEADSDVPKYEIPPPLELYEPDALETRNYTGLCSLSNRLLLRVLMFLPVSGALTVTAVCQYLNSIQFSKEYMRAIGVSFSHPLSTGRHSFSRGYLIEALHKEVLSKQQKLQVHHSVVVSPRVSTLLLVQEVAGKTVFFSEADGKLQVWSVFRDRQTTHYSLECSPDIVAVAVVPGKVGIICRYAIEVKRLPWETLQAADVSTAVHSTKDDTHTGALFFFPKFGVVATMLNMRLMVFRDDMSVLLEHRRGDWPFSDVQCVQVGKDLPYLAIAGKTSIQIFDVTKNRTTPVFKYTTPTLIDFKFAFVYVSEVLSRCFLVLHNGLRSTTGAVIVNNSVLCKAAGDFSIVHRHLLVFDCNSMVFRRFVFSLHGPMELSQFSIHERVVDVQLNCIEQRVLLLARKAHSRDSYSIRLFDYNGWKYSRIPLDNFVPEKTYTFPGSITVVGTVVETSTKAMIQFHYYKIGSEFTSIKKRVEKALLAQVVSKKDVIKEQIMREEEMRKRREAKRAEIKAKKEREKLQNSVFWRPSRRTFPNVELDLQEDFFLV